MGTGLEIQLMSAQAERSLQPILDAYKRLSRTVVDNAWWHLFGREVGARRARVLRRRGDDVRFYRRTSTGKARYQWLPALRRVSP